MARDKFSPELPEALKDADPAIQEAALAPHALNYFETEWSWLRARELARDHKVSVSEVIRMAMNKMLDRNDAVLGGRLSQEALHTLQFRVEQNQRRLNYPQPLPSNE